MMYGVLGKGIWTLLPRSQCDITEWAASLLAFISTSIGLGRPAHHHRGNVPISSVDSQGSRTSLQCTKKVFFLYGSRWPARHVMRVFHLTSALQERRCSPASSKTIWSLKPSRKKVTAMPALTVPCPALVLPSPASTGLFSCGAPIRALRAKEVVLTLFRRVDQALIDPALSTILMRLVSSSN